jgi:hypothetical protein
VEAPEVQVYWPAEERQRFQELVWEPIREPVWEPVRQADRAAELVDWLAWAAMRKAESFAGSLPAECSYCNH